MVSWLLTPSILTPPTEAIPRILDSEFQSFSTQSAQSSQRPIRFRKAPPPIVRTLGRSMFNVRCWTFGVAELRRGLQSADRGASYPIRSLIAQPAHAAGSDESRSPASGRAVSASSCYLVLRYLLLLLGGCSGFYPWLECAAASRESWVSRKSPCEKITGNTEEMPLAA